MDSDFLQIMFGDGESINAILAIFPSGQERILEAAQVAMSHPEQEHFPVVIHGEEPLTLKITLPRAALLSIASQILSPKTTKRIQ